MHDESHSRWRQRTYYGDRTMQMVVLWVALGTVGAVDEQELAERVRAGFERVIKSRCDWKFRCEDRRFNAVAVEKNFVANVSYNGRDQSFRWHYESEVAAEKFVRVMCMNSDYGFELLRKDDEAWKVQEVSVSASPSGAVAKNKLMISILAPDYKIFVYNWHEIVSDPSFKITRFDDKGDEWVVAFKADGSPRSGGQVVRGKVTLDPEFCLLRSFEAEILFQSGERGFYSGRTDHKGELDGIPVMHHHEYKDVERSTGKPVTSQALVYSDISRGDIAGSDVRLTAFGLPEPAGLGRDFPTWVILVATGIVCLGIAAWVKTRAARPGSKPGLP